MKIWHISDTHSLHSQLTPPDGIDVVVHSGDASNSQNPYRNESELRDFLKWFSSLPIPQKIFTPGNHDTSLEKGLILKSEIESLGIIPLIESGVTINGINFFGTPWVPRYGEWAWMTKRETISRKWELIPDDTDVLITHGPPFSILDSTESSRHYYELVGCRALQKKVKKLDLSAHLFGHVHSVKDIRNSGTKTMHGLKTVFSNGSCCDDGKMDFVTSNGNIITLS